MNPQQEKLCGIISRELGKPVGLQLTFEELGVDSLDFTDIVQKVEQEFGSRVSDEQLASINTVEDLYKAVAVMVI